MDIRKTDSKGRLSLGTPDISYRIFKLESGSISLTPIPISRNSNLSVVDEQEPRWKTPQVALDYLMSLGVDPKRILIGSKVTPEGFDELQFNERGERLYFMGEPYKIWRTWPEGFNWDEFVTLATKGAK